MRNRFSIVGFSVVVVALLGLAVWFFPAKAQANSLTVYDTFDGVGYLNQFLWHASAGHFPGGLDVVREIERRGRNDGELRMAATAYSYNGGGYEFGTRLNNPDGGGPGSIRAIEIEIKITDCAFTACGEEWDEITDSRFEMMGAFFNTGLTTCPVKDDVSAAIMLRPTPDGDGNDFHVWARIMIDPWDPTFEHWFDLGTDLGWIITKGVSSILGIQWSQATQEFIFRLNNDTHAISYATWLANRGGTDMTPPCGGGFKTIRPMIGLPDGCPGELMMGSLEFLIDNVRIESVPFE